MTNESELNNITILGKQVAPKFCNPSAEMLEWFPNPYPNNDYEVVHCTDEFTSVCPKTGQPDFATVEIRFTPNQRCVESKSLKLYLAAYRNEGAFMEKITNQILNDLVKCMEPKELDVSLTFKARGGIRTSVHASYIANEL